MQIRVSTRKGDLHLHLGHLADATYNKYICQKKEKQYIAVCTVKICIETRAKQLQSLC